MKPWRAITRMLSILAILGLVLAPFTVPAVAGGMAESEMRISVVTARMPTGDAVAPGSLPCCAPVLPFMPDGPKSCPLAAMCHAKVVEGVALASAALRWSSPARTSLPVNDATPDTLSQAPPARPPQA